MQVIETNNVPIKAWVDGVAFEDVARRQVENVASLPFVYKHVAIDAVMAAQRDLVEVVHELKQVLCVKG